MLLRKNLRDFCARTCARMGLREWSSFFGSQTSDSGCQKKSEIVLTELAQVLNTNMHVSYGVLQNPECVWDGSYDFGVRKPPV